MTYWAINKRTKIKYGPIDEATKRAYESTPSTNVFIFVVIKPTPRAEFPKGIKKIEKRKPERSKRKTKTAQNDKTK